LAGIALPPFIRSGSAALYVGVAHVDWDTTIDNCFGLLCTSKKHVFLIKKDLLFDNASTLPHALRLTDDLETNRLLFASPGIDEIDGLRGLRNGGKSKSKSKGRGKGKGKAAKRARHCWAWGVFCCTRRALVLLLLV
jgi:hypothetical protein